MENDYLEVDAVEQPTALEPELSPAQMFFNDLIADEVSSDYEDDYEDVVESEEAPEEYTVDAVEVPEGMYVSNPIPSEDNQPTMATLNDVEDAKNAIMSEIIRMAAIEEAKKNAYAEAEQVNVEPELTKEEKLEKYYENPLDTIEQLAEAKANEKLQGVMAQLQPLLEQSKAAQERDSITRVITDFMGNTPDARDYMDDIVPYIKGHALNPNDPKSFIDAYRDLKIGRQGNLISQLQEQANQGRSLDDYLGDEQSLNQILNNENIKSKVIENYLKGIQNGAKPQTISGGGTVQAVGTAPNAPKSFNEAADLFKASL